MKDTDLIWEKKSSQRILRTPVFDVDEIQCRGPENESGSFVVIEARDWATVIPVLENDFLMVKQWRHGHQGLSIEFPGGVVERAETPEQGARRELMEETGFSAGKLTHLGTINPNPALFANRFHVFLAENLEEVGARHLDEDEFLDYMRIPMEDVFEKMGNADYPHALMCAALGMYMQHQRRQSKK